MKRLLLIDGNSLLFRGYYATLYGHMMRTSNGIPTNAVYAFISMVNKGIELIQPDHVLVAWDSGKPTFRHEMYEEYKGTRKKVEDDLIVQFSIVREYLDALGIPRYEQDGIEADDIIGSMSKQCDAQEVYILSSDKDLLQLIDDRTKVVLTKKGLSEVEITDAQKLKENMGVTPLQIIELKSLMGDASDNIPGVPGVGEKTAVKLLESYETLDGVYEHLDEIKGKLHEKLAENKEKAYLSKTLATIKIDAKLPCLEDELIIPTPTAKAYEFYTKYEMERLAKTLTLETTMVEKQEVKVRRVDRVSKELLEEDTAFYVSLSNTSFCSATCYGFAFSNGKLCEYISLENLKQDQSTLDFLKSKKDKVTCDVKNVYHTCYQNGIEIDRVQMDVVIAGFLLNGQITSYEKLLEIYEIPSEKKYEEVYGKNNKHEINDEEMIQYAGIQAYNISNLIKTLDQKLVDFEMKGLFDRIEMPLAYVLFEMEKNGIVTDLKVLDAIALETEEKIAELSSEIYKMAGREFNINSPKQLSIVLFDDLGLPTGKKRSTAADVLEKLVDVHPMVSLLLQQRKYQKIYSTYAVGLSKYIQTDGKIHTIFNQTLAQTGRLSSSEPNLQNISVKDEEGKVIRKAFVASPNSILLSADYSQIELRVLAHMANEKKMIEAFNQGIDIHTQTACEIYGVHKEEVTAKMRRNAKTVNFGIVYGQTDFGLSEQLGISRKEAKEFIEKYFESYPNIKVFMDQTIAFCEKEGYVKTMLNRRRYIPEIHDKNFMMREFGKRAAMNAPIQGSAADIIKLAMIDIEKEMRLQKMKSKMVLQIHDELIFDVVEEEKELMRNMVEEGMSQVIRLQVPLLAEAQFGKTWYDAK